MPRKATETKLKELKKPDRLCPYHHIPLDEIGFCWEGGGYPYKLFLNDSPFSCPLCHHALAWNGGCGMCNGTTTISDLDSRTFSGTPYKLEKNHWVPTGEPPGQKVVQIAQQKECYMVVRSVLNGDMSVELGTQVIGKILEEKTNET